MLSSGGFGMTTIKPTTGRDGYGAMQIAIRSGLGLPKSETALPHCLQCLEVIFNTQPKPWNSKNYHQPERKVFSTKFCYPWYPHQKTWMPET